MRIQVTYFAGLKEKAGLGEETIHTFSKTPLELYDELKKKYDFTLKEKEIRVAVNHRFQEMDCQLQDSDLVVFIPPVAGG